MTKTFTFDRAIDPVTGKPPLRLVVEFPADFDVEALERQLEAVGKAAYAEGVAIRKAFGEASQ